MNFARDFVNRYQFLKQKTLKIHAKDLVERKFENFPKFVDMEGRGQVVLKEVFRFPKSEYVAVNLKKNQFTLKILELKPYIKICVFNRTQGFCVKFIVNLCEFHHNLCGFYRKFVLG
jgi:hypothetical protein